MTDELPRVLLDTNVWISAFINPAGSPAYVLSAFLEQRYVLVITNTLMAEIEDVLTRPHIARRLRMSHDLVRQILEGAREYGVTLTPSGELHLCRDPKDDFLLEAAILGDVRYLVSRDDDVKRDLELTLHLAHQGVTVLSVAQFLAILDE